MTKMTFQAKILKSPSSPQPTPNLTTMPHHYQRTSSLAEITLAGWPQQQSILAHAANNKEELSVGESSQPPESTGILKQKLNFIQSPE